MIRNFLQANARALWRHRSHTSINLIGLALGLTAAITIFSIIRFELSYDDYHPNRDQIFRVVTEFTGSPKPGFSAGITYPLPPALAQEFPEVQYISIVDSNMGDPVITVPEADGSHQKFVESHVTFADPDYFKILAYTWLEGNPDALQTEKSVVLTRSTAQKYFGDESALNKIINFNNEFDATVTGVVDNPPLNTDFPFQIIFSSRLGADKRGWEEWGASSSSINCLIKLHAGTNASDLNTKMDGWHLKYFTGDNEQDGKTRRYYLQPLSAMHFDTRFTNFAGRVVSYSTLFTLGAIGMLLLLTACINFINLNTVFVIDRAKEAGIRKVVGSSRAQLVGQFLTETFAITVVALLLSCCLVEIVLINLTPVLGYRLEFNPLSDLATTAMLLILPIIVTLLAGLYPGLALSRFQPITALRTRINEQHGGFSLRRLLIIFQLVITQVLIVSTIIIVQQLRHFEHQSLGIDSEAVVEFELPVNGKEIIHKLRERLSLIPGVSNVAMSNTGSTASNQWMGDANAEVNGRQVKVATSVKFADNAYTDTYKIALLYGENLLDTDTATRFLVNESFTRALGFQDPAEAIGVPVDIWGNNAMISGIVRDFNTTSLHDAIRPAIILNGTDAVYVGAIRLNAANMMETIARVRDVWEDLYPQYVFSYAFLDDTIANFYEAERRTSYLIGLFAGVAIFIGCIGLLGLISFMAKRKTKEVGIRKSLGASVTQVVKLFSVEFAALIGASFIIAAPLAYYTTEEWLSNFAYRIEPGLMTYAIGLVVTFVIVMATVGYKAFKAATANPVNALRTE